MYYLLIFWILLVAFFVLYIFVKYFKWSTVLHFLDSYGILFFIVLLSLIVIAIATNDPIIIAGMEIPVELQWLSSLLASGFGVWQFYLRPLKNKVYEIDRDVASLNSDVKSIKEDVHLIKEVVLRAK